MRIIKAIWPLGILVLMMLACGKSETDSPATQKVESDMKFGLSETKRKAIYKVLVRNEDKAFMEAEKIYPVVDKGSAKANMEQMGKQSDIADSLKQIYDKQVAERNGLSLEQIDSISVEGGWKNWPI